MRGRLALVGFLGACGGSGQAVVRQPAPVAMQTATSRLLEQGIALDPTPRNAERTRSVWFCWVPPGREGLQWPQTFASPGPGPRPFDVDGDQQAQDAARARCAYQLRFELNASPSPDGTVLRFTSEWMRVATTRCDAVEPVLLGRQACKYTWRPAAPPARVESWLDDLLNGL